MVAGKPLFLNCILNLEVSILVVIWDANYTLLYSLEANHIS